MTLYRGRGVDGRRERREGSGSITRARGSTALVQGAALEGDGTWYVGSNVSSTAVNTGAGTVNVAAGYYLNQKNVTPGTLQVAQSTPANPAGTASTAGVMMGVSGAITPQATSRVRAAVTGDVFTSGAAGNGASVQLRWGTGHGPGQRRSAQPGPRPAASSNTSPRRPGRNRRSRSRRS